MRLLALILAFFAFASGALVRSCPGAILIRNSPPNFREAFQSDYARSPQQIADDFLTPSGSLTITNIEWWGIYLNNTPNPVDNFAIQLFNNDTSSATPRPTTTPFASLTLNSLTRVDTLANIWIYDVYKYSAAITPISLAPNQTYWLSIYNNSSVAPGRANWYWATSGNTHPVYSTWLRSGPGKSWSAIHQDFAFAVSASPPMDPVPEPSSAALFGLALATLGCAATLGKRSRARSPMA